LPNPGESVRSAFIGPVFPTFFNGDYHTIIKILRQHGFKVSLSGKGNCYGNAAVEALFKTIKVETIWRQSSETRRQAEMSIIGYINGFYNPHRRHSTLGWKSPVGFERKAALTSTWSGIKPRQLQLWYSNIGIECKMKNWELDNPCY